MLPEIVSWAYFIEIDILARMRVGNGGALRGPLGFAIYNPAVAEALHLLHDSLIKEGTLGTRVNELAILIATRETNFSSEWNSHEPAALKAGVDPATIDVVRFNKDALAAEDAHQIVLQREIKARSAGVALPAGAAAELIIDAPGFVGLGAEHVQSDRKSTRLN